MADINQAPNPLYLRDQELRQSMELLFYAYRGFTAQADALLDEHKFGRAHHRVIYFVGRYPSISVAELLGILHITKQSLSRVLGQLVAEGFITQRSAGSPPTVEGSPGHARPAPAAAGPDRAGRRT